MEADFTAGVVINIREWKVVNSLNSLSCVDEFVFLNTLMFSASCGQFF